MSVVDIEVEKKSKVCTVKHTPICKFLGCDGCEKCSLYGHDVKEFEKQRTNEIWEVTQSNLPWEADDFHNSETCYFCKKRPGNKKIGYGQVELAHPEPAVDKNYVFGILGADKNPVGSLIPFPIAICKDCKRRFNLVENIKFYSVSVGFIIGLAIVYGFSWTDWIKYSPLYVNVALVLFCMAAAYGIGGFLARRLIKKYENEMYFKVFDIPEMSEFEEMGWFVYREEADKSRMVITKKKPRQNFNFFSMDTRQPEEPENAEE